MMITCYFLVLYGWRNYRKLLSNILLELLLFKTWSECYWKKFCNLLKFKFKICLFCEKWFLILSSHLNRVAIKKPVGILHVNVVRAQKLLKMDLLGTSDPYVKLSLTGDKLPAKKTTVKRKNLNPVWNEKFKMVVKDPQSQVLQLQVYDWDKVFLVFLLLLVQFWQKNRTIKILSNSQAVKIIMFEWFSPNCPFLFKVILS